MPKPVHASPVLETSGPAMGRPAMGRPSPARTAVSAIAVPAAAVAAILLLPALAMAHDGHGGHAAGFMTGFLHPIGGLDHLLAMVAVGLFAALLGGRAMVLVPLSFLAAMAAGGILGMAGIALPMAELGIALSVLVLGLAVAFRVRPVTLAAAALVGVFALFHGHAHGAEMPATGSGLLYVAGFLLATALLHGAGLLAGGAAGLGSRRLALQANRVGGAAIAAIGGAMLAGIV